MTATFGDLALAGSEHLDTAIVLWMREPTPEIAAGIIRSMHNAVQVMFRCAHDITENAPANSVAHPRAHIWLQAAADIESGLRAATVSLAATTGHLSLVGKHALSTADSHMRQAGQYLAAARDLLQTHRSVRPESDATSDWTEAINAPEFCGALLTEIGGWAQRMADLLAQTFTVGPALPGQSSQLCLRAYQGLQAAAVTTELTATHVPVPPAVTQLLHAMRSSALPARCPPHDPEPIQELCHQAAVSAQRVRVAVRQAARQAYWSPTINTESWQWMAAGGSITSHLAGLLLETISQPEDPSSSFPLGGQIPDVTRFIADSHAGWKEAASAWDTVTTESYGLTAPAIDDMTDLILRLGRITFDNPRWTPDRAQQAPPRWLGNAARSPAELTAAVGVAHEAMETLACVAAADHQAIKLADRAWRLHARRSSLPTSHGISRLYGPATPLQVEAVLQAYELAASSSTHAATMLGELALAIDTPSVPLAIARKLVSSVNPSHKPVPKFFAPRASAPASGIEADALHIPGPAERKLVSLGVTDPFTLLRAIVIDSAARALVADVKPTVARRRVLNAPDARSAKGQPTSACQQSEQVRAPLQLERSDDPVPHP